MVVILLEGPCSNKILGIEEDYETVDLESSALETAVYNLGTMFYPKRKEDKRAKKAWNMVHSAGQELGCRNSVFNEVYEYNDDDDVDSNKGDRSSQEMDGVQFTRPSKIIDGLYTKATPLMAQLLKNPKSYSAKKKVNSINDEIRDLNKKEGQEDTDRWVIDVLAIAKYYTDVSPFVDRYKADNSDEDAIKEAKRIKKELETFLNNHHYPLWTLDEHILSTKISAPVAQKTSGTKSSSSPVAQKKGAEQTVAAAATVWKPGLTAKGDQILGMSPLERTDVEGEVRILKCSYYVEKKGEKNPMACEDSGKVGKEASHAYLHDIPKSEQRDLRINKNKYTSADQEGFMRIKAVHAKAGYSSNIFPDTTIWAEYEQGVGDKVLKRTGFRQIWGSHMADRMIEDFYIDKGLDLPWEKQAKRPGRNRRSMGENRRRSPSVSSIDSRATYLTDEGMDRVNDVEYRMSNLEKLMECIDAKLGKMPAK